MIWYGLWAYANPLLCTASVWQEGSKQKPPCRPSLLNSLFLFISLFIMGLAKLRITMQKNSTYKRLKKQPGKSAPCTSGAWIRHHNPLAFLTSTEVLSLFTCTLGAYEGHGLNSHKTYIPHTPSMPTQCAPASVHPQTGPEHSAASSTVTRHPLLES